MSGWKAQPDLRKSLNELGWIGVKEHLQIAKFAIAYPPNVDVSDGLLAVGWLSRIIYVLRFYDANPPYQKTAPSRQTTLLL